MAYHDWSAPVGADVNDVELWYDCNPALGIRIAEEYVASELAALGPEKFGTERLGIWPIQGDQRWAVIPKADWIAGGDPGSPRPERVAFAVTLSTDRRWATITAAGPRADGLFLVHCVERREGTGWVIPRLKELDRAWNPVAKVIYRNSPAESHAAEAELEGLELTPITATEQAAALGAFVDGFAGRPAPDPDTGEMGRDPRVLRHREQPELTAAIAAAVVRRMGMAQTWDPLSSSTDITPAIGCSNALWGFMTNQPVAVEALVAWR
jgi:hypothetical protein